MVRRVCGDVASVDYSTRRFSTRSEAHTFIHMVERQQLDPVFHALGDGTRRQMLKGLRKANGWLGSKVAAPPGYNRGDVSRRSTESLRCD